MTSFVLRRTHARARESWVRAKRPAHRSSSAWVVLLTLGSFGCEAAEELGRIAGCDRIVRAEDSANDECLVLREDVSRGGAFVIGAGESDAGESVAVTDAEALWRCGDEVPCRVRVIEEDAVLDEAIALRFVEPARATELARSVLGDPDAPRRVRAQALLGRLRGAHDPEGAVVTLRSSSEQSAALGLWTEAMRDAVAEANLLRARLFRFAESRDALARVASLAARDPGMAIELRYHEGLVARDVGDVRRALALFADGVQRARERRDRRRERETLGAHARLLGALGRDAEAEEAWARLATLDGDDACAAADRATNRGWEALLAAERGEPTIAVARAELARAAETYDAACVDPGRRANARLNVALVDFHEGRFEDARRGLEAVSEREDAAVRAWRAILIARLATNEREGLEALAGVSVEGAPELAWRVAVERARLLETSDPDAAIALLQDVESRLEAELLGVPIEAGRAGFVGRRDESLRALVRIAIATGRAEVALEALRRGLAREARALAVGARFEAMDDATRGRFEEALGRHRALRVEIAARAADAWSLAEDARRERTDEIEALEALAREALDEAHATFGGGVVHALPEMGDGEVTLALWRDGGDVIAVVGDAREARATRIGGTDATSIERALPALAEVLARSRRVRVVTSSSLHAIDVGTLRWREGVTLHATHDVVEAMDVPRVVDVRDATRGRALVVVDPRGDLHGAHEEADGVARTLAADGLVVETLEGDAAAHAPVVQRLREAEVFHYAGHHVAAPGLQSALPLAADGTLDVRDVLALSGAPTQVILSGCGTAARGGGTEPSGDDRRATDSRGGVSLAQAFVLVGAGWAVGTSRTIDDAAAARFLARWRELGLDEAGFFAARRASLVEGDVDASAFRWVVP